MDSERIAERRTLQFAFIPSSCIAIAWCLYSFPKEAVVSYKTLGYLKGVKQSTIKRSAKMGLKLGVFEGVRLKRRFLIRLTNESRDFLSECIERLNRKRINGYDAIEDD